MIGKNFKERYQIQRVVGSGGMSTVYLALDTILDREVSVKVLRSEFSQNDTHLKRFNREAQAVSTLSHPNIVSIYDVGEEDGMHFLVMEYIDGMTLKEYIQTFKPLSIEKTLDIMKQLTSAVSHAHRNQIVHRDIKPQNILINKAGLVKVTDFGIASAITNETITHTNSSVLGSVHYLSPEQARGGQANRKSDIYALGIVMYEMLTGDVPFAGDTAVSIALMHLQGQIPYPKDKNQSIPQSVENVVLKATSKDPLNRYTSIEEMAADLSTVLNSERVNEPRYEEPVDEFATKVIPVVDGDEDNIDTDGDGIPDAVDPSDAEATKATAKPAKNKKPIIIGASIAAAVIAFLFVFTPFQKEVEIPDVEGMSVDEATDTLEDLGLNVTDVEKATDPDLEPNTVVKTNPKIGSEVEEGSDIVLYATAEEELTVVSDYTGRVYEDIKSTIEKVGYEDIDVNDAESDDYEAGIIIAQNPEPGTEVNPEETTLELTVSTGSSKVVLEDLSGYSNKALNDYAKAVGINIESIDQYDPDVAEGNVISQDPAPGTKVEKGSTVTVIVSKGPEPAPEPEVKSVPYTVDITYTGDGETPQTVVIYIQDSQNNMNNPYATFEISSDTSKTYDLMLKPGESGKIRVEVDGEVVEETTVPYK